MFFVAELSNGQMLDDVRLAVAGKRPVKFYGRMGGMVPTTQEILKQIKEILLKRRPRQQAEYEGAAQLV